jgi:acylphosphatase
MEHSHERLHAIVEGDVQGVGYRVFVVRAAGTLGLHGWVRNRFDGSVEVMAEGERAALEALVRELTSGPRAASVGQVAVEWLPATMEFADFRVRFV